MFKLDLERAEEPKIKLPASVGSLEKQENSRKTSALLTMPEPLTPALTLTVTLSLTLCGSQRPVENF